MKNTKLKLAAASLALLLAGCGGPGSDRSPSRHAGADPAREL